MKFEKTGMINLLDKTIWAIQNQLLILLLRIVEMIILIVITKVVLTLTNGMIHIES
jgi:hypothetical protein